MRGFERLPAPDFLLEKFHYWGVQWEKRHSENPSAQFNWRQIDGEKVRDLLLVPLKKQTSAHCSFCDCYPVSPPGDDTIEHFKPKSAYPLEAYCWENLYFCCNHCQKKGADYDVRLLRPDAEGFRFEDYFRWEYSTGELKPNPESSSENQRRAEITIELYLLNVRHPELRRMELRKYMRAGGDLREWSYTQYLSNASSDSLM